MAETNKESSPPLGKRGDLLRRLAKKLISVTGNDKINKKLSRGGYGRVFNIFDEASQFVLDDLNTGKKLKIVGVRDNDDEYFTDEQTPKFKQFCEKLIREREEKDGLPTNREALRIIKNKVRERLGLPNSSELIPDRNVDLIYGASKNILKKRHVDDELQTDLDWEDAQKLLRKIEAERVHILRERGLDSLYIAFGFLEWKKEDSNNKTKSFNSPLCLMKVSLATDKKKEKYKLLSDGDLEDNSDLIEALKQDTGYSPPSISDYWREDGKKNSFELEEFHKAFEHFIRKYKGWKVRNRIAVGIFKSRGIDSSEIDPNNFSNESVDRTETLLAGSGFRAEPNGDREVDAPKDRKRVPAFVLQVDSSQHAAILEVSEGRDAVIEGPPGTGKSHTIVNLIADAMRRGKTVLFLAQKVAALDVVYSRLSEKELGLNKKSIRLYSKHATRTVLYGKSGEINKKIASVRESKANNLLDTCNKRDECLTELNDFAHLMLKKIHGETYQNVITTSKVRESDIGSERKPKFKLSSRFDLKDDHDDIARIREISQITEGLDDTAKSLLKTIRCEQTDPFKIEELTNTANRINSELEPFLKNYGNHSLLSCRSNAEQFDRSRERRLLMEQTFNDLINYKSASHKGDAKIFDKLLDETIFTNSTLDKFDSINALKSSEDVAQKLNEIFELRSQLEGESKLCEDLIKQSEKIVSGYQLKVIDSNPNSHPHLKFPKNLKFIDDQLLTQDLAKIDSAIKKVKQANRKRSQIRNICFELNSSDELKTHYDLLQSKGFSLISCHIPFSKASSSRKFLISIFKEKTSFSDLRRKTDDLIALTANTESTDGVLQSEGLLFSEDELLKTKETLETVSHKLKALKNLSTQLAKRGYLEDKSEAIAEESRVVKKILEMVSAINLIKEEFSESSIKDFNSDQIKQFIDTFLSLSKILESAVQTADELECSSVPETATDIHSLLSSIIGSRTSLTKIFAINANLAALEKSKGIGEWCRELFEQNVSVEDKYIAHLYRFITKKISSKDRAVFQYKQKFYQNLKKKFAKLEQQSREELAHSIRTQMPNSRDIPTVHKLKVGEKGGNSLLEHVANTNARVTVRELCDRAFDSLKHYCNCFLMTPSSVANYIPRNTTFDLVIIDEASQMLPEEAVGSILRSEQVVVVGDPMQMPPFKGMVTTLYDEEYDNPDEDDGMGKQTSILDLASQSFSDYRRLRYHYRSEDENLIRFSNKEFYENDLITIPNQHQGLEHGVHYVNAKGTYNSGKSGCSKNPNKEEAEKLVELIIQEVRERPDWSLGVAVINQQQAIRVEEILRERTEMDTKFREFESKWSQGSEYFFIKNLENVQGDERDTILISTVYGRDADGKAHNRFGPINFTKGENRINVLVTRAKKRVVLCSSMFPNDITSQSTGAQVLRRYLQYAMTGEMDGANSGHSEDHEHYYDAPWEKWFHDRLEADGFIVDPQVGVSSWRIDLGVKHNDYPAGYICGIELDGPDHLSLSARDRDIERQSILERKGWTIFRVWSMDFFNDMEGEYQIIKKAIESTLREKVATLKIEPEPKLEPLIKEEVSTASPSQILGY